MGNQFREFSRDVTIINELGLHARSAAGIAKIARNAKSNVWITKDRKKADAKSIIDILTLVCAQGSKITVTVDNCSDIHILDNIVELIESGFGE